MHALDAYIKKGRQFFEEVWFTGTTALKEGQAVCYDWDRGTQTAKDYRRLNYVEAPSTTNAQWFAGVADGAYSAKSTGQVIRIFRPGSTCNIYTKADNTIGVGLLTFDVTSGYEGWFRYSGLRGEGSAIPLQTVDRGTDEGVCQALLLGGEPSGGVEVVQLVDNIAWVAMVGGTSLVIGYAGTNHAAEEILDGTVEGLRKKVQIITTAVSTGGTCIVDIENDDGLDPADGSQDLDGVYFTAVGAGVVFQWNGGCWNVIGQDACSYDTT